MAILMPCTSRNPSWSVGQKNRKGCGAYACAAEGKKGRRCEIINLPNQPGLIGKTCVVEMYLPNKSRYKVIFEATKEVGHVGPQNLIRRDRTPDDCGYYINYNNGKTTRHEFASNEECQAFVASLSQGGDKSGGFTNIC
jgi:hypothetical protein